MMTYSIDFPDELFVNLRNELFSDPDRETAAFVLAGIHRKPDGYRLLAREMIVVRDDQYLERNDIHMQVAAQQINRVAAAAERAGLSVIMCHSHIQSSGALRYSLSDDFGEERLSRFFRECTGGRPVGSILLRPPDSSIGRIWLAGLQGPVRLSRITTIGDTIHVVWGPSPTSATTTRPRYDRQARMLGTDGQALLERTCIGIVGVGGTGSAVAEQLTRLGVGKLVLVDDDRLDESNLSRVYGSYPCQLPEHRKNKRTKRLNPPKVEIVAQHLCNIDPRIHIKSIFGNVAVTNDLIHLLECDAIMLCTDEHWGRSVINQISYQYLIPVINMGVRVDAPSGIIQGATGVVHTIGPDKPCLWCYQYLSGKRIAAESMPPETREERIRENYIEDIGPAPMVISLTSTVASLAVTELLHMLTDFRGERAFHSLRYDILDASFSRCTATRGTSCLCSQVEGYGDLAPLPSIDDRGHVERCRLR